jgi:pimeloyl-ACP methyl ester carboxylesterase
MKNKITPFFCLLLIGLQGFSQQQATKHPQTPLPPFPYKADSVEYDNADKTVHLAGTFTYPKTKGPFVTLLMITGSGQQDRDETLLGHKPFLVIADYLTKKGFAVLRVDDRGMGKSKGQILKATSADFAEDAITSIQYLLTRSEVNKKKIGVIGHSEGGLIAPMVYTKWLQLAFIISLAGTGVSGAEVLLKQQTDPVKGVVNNAAFDAYYLLTQQTLSAIHDNPTEPDSAILNKVKEIYRDWKNNKPDSVLVPLHADKATPEMYEMQIKHELIPWWKYFISTEPSIFWEKVKCPVLALNGEKDIQVYPQQNLTAITSALKKAGNKKVTPKILPGLNHLFQTCTKCTVKEYGELEETFSPDALKIINDWLNKNLK